VRALCFELNTPSMHSVAVAHNILVKPSLDHRLSPQNGGPEERACKIRGKSCRLPVRYHQWRSQAWAMFDWGNPIGKYEFKSSLIIEMSALHFNN